MGEHHDPHQRKELVVLHDFPSKLEEELLSRALENGTAPETEAAEILERHAWEAGDTE